MESEAFDGSALRWPDLNESYIDEFGPIDATVYAAARALWPRACRHASAQLHDESAGQRLLFKATAAVSRQDLAQLDDLHAYLWTSFERLVQAEGQRRQRDHSADDELNRLPHPPGVTADDIIFLETFLGRMDKKTRQALERHAAGYTYEEQARLLGTQANVLRSKVAKEIKRVLKLLGQ